MGASGWDYAVDVDEDVAAALERLRQQLFAEGDYLGPGGWGPSEREPRPGSIDELLDAQAGEGTHSILDICDGVSDAPVECAASPLTPQQLHDFFETPSPSCTQVQAWMDGAAYDEVRERWEAVYIVCHEHGAARHLHFGGFSGD